VIQSNESKASGIEVGLSKNEVIGGCRQNQGGGPSGQRQRQRRNSTWTRDGFNEDVTSVVRAFDISSARRLLLDNVLNRVTNSQAASLRRKAADQLTTQGNSAPFLALLGVSLASGSGIITKEDEIESVCCEIRQTVGKTRLLQCREEKTSNHNKHHQWSLEDFELGTAIAKGCAAVVYSAKLRTEERCQTSEYPFAIKMMFNYHAESNAYTILRAMHRETVPSRSINIPDEMKGLYNCLDDQQIRIGAHPNIVEMVTVFTDRVPCLPGDIQLYGEALPMRINPKGYGRNMSLFLVMKKYDLSLAQYLERYKDEISPRTSLILFTQLLEGVSYLSSNGVAHRDIKSDNLLLSLSGGPQFPQLVITDFGCCSADRQHRLKLPYRTWDTDKGGNSALMAPEVSVAKPGTFSTINYERSDLWTAGTLAYQIFGGENPFCSSSGPSLDSRTYNQSLLPNLPLSTPKLVKLLVHSILTRNPSERPSPRLAATVCQLLLWAPSTWYKGRDCRMPGSQDVLQWLLTMTTKVVCESRWGNTAGALFEYQLVATFLATMNFNLIRSALNWIQENAEENFD